MPRILGVDYGSRRLGFAVSDEDGLLALPVCVVPVKSDRQALAETERLCREKLAGRIVVGLPLNMNGSRGPAAQQAERFAEALRQRMIMPVELWDERLSSAQAERILLGADVSRRRRREAVDKLAAQIVLQSYLDAKAPRTGLPDEN